MPKGEFGGSFYDVGVSNTGSPLWNTKRVSARQCTWGGRTSGSYFGKEFSNMGKGQYAHLSYAVGVANKGDALFTRSSESEPALLRSRRHLTFIREDMQSETRTGGRSSVYDDELHNRPSRRLQSGRRPQSASAPDTRRVSHVPSRQPSRPPSNPPSMPPSRHTRCVASTDPSCRGSRAASASASRLHSRRPSKEFLRIGMMSRMVGDANEPPSPTPREGVQAGNRWRKDTWNAPPAVPDGGGAGGGSGLSRSSSAAPHMMPPRASSHERVGLGRPGAGESASARLSTRRAASARPSRLHSASAASLLTTSPATQLEAIVQQHVGTEPGEREAMGAHHTLTVVVEQCVALRPTPYLRGSNSKYCEAFTALSEALEPLHGNGTLNVVKNPPEVGSPRVGAFEVSFTLADSRSGATHGPYLLFSKLERSIWPNSRRIAEQLAVSLNALIKHTAPS